MSAKQNNGELRKYMPKRDEAPQTLPAGCDMAHTARVTMIQKQVCHETSFKVGATALEVAEHHELVIDPWQ